MNFQMSMDTLSITSTKKTARTVSIGKKLRRSEGSARRRKGKKGIRRRDGGLRPKKSDGYEKKRKERIVIGRMAGKRRPRKKERSAKKKRGRKERSVTRRKDGALKLKRRGQ